MRCRSVGAALILALALAPPGALAQQVPLKDELARHFEGSLGGAHSEAFALGAGAFDEALRARVEAGAGDAAAVVEKGRRLWTRKFRNGRTLAACFPNGGRRVAATYPHYDARVKGIVTLEMAVNQCLKAHGEPLLDPADPETMGAVAAYVRSLAAGRKVAVRVPRAAEAAFAEGRRLYFARMGQRNFACASCHVQGAGRIYGATPLSPAIGQAARWPFVRAGAPVTLQARMRRCLELMGAAPFAAGSDELNHLEYFLTYLSNGLPMRPNAWRPEASP